MKHNKKILKFFLNNSNTKYNISLRTYNDNNKKYNGLELFAVDVVENAMNGNISEFMLRVMDEINLQRNEK